MLQCRACCCSTTRLWDYVVSVGAELPEGLDKEPGTFIPRPIQCDSHGILLQQSGQTLVHRQIFVAFHVKQLRMESILGYGFLQNHNLSHTPSLLLTSVLK